MPAFIILAVVAALLSGTVRAEAPASGVEEDAVLALETPARVLRRFDGVLRIGYADSPGAGPAAAVMEPLAERLAHALRGAGENGSDVSVELRRYAEFDLQTAVVSHEADLFLVTSGYYVYLADMGAGV